MPCNINDSIVAYHHICENGILDKDHQKMPVNREQGYLLKNNHFKWNLITKNTFRNRFDGAISVKPLLLSLIA
jgi:hypothetical protein